MNRKIIGIFIFTLLLIPILSSTSIASQEPIIEIGRIRGRSRLIRMAVLLIEIKNTGDVDAFNVSLYLGIKHPIFKILNITIGGENLTIDIIKAGTTKELDLGLSWIGRFELTVKAWISEGVPVTKTVKGFSIFGFIVIFPE
jgi:hypothetical protein